MVFGKIILISYAYAHPHVCGHDENAAIGGMTSAIETVLFLRRTVSKRSVHGVQFTDGIKFNINNNDIWDDFVVRIKYTVRTPKTTRAVSGNGIALQNKTDCRDNVLCFKRWSESLAFDVEKNDKILLVFDVHVRSFRLPH